jgi:hypothetical protein
MMFTMRQLLLSACCCACSGQPVGASDMSSVAALLEGCVLCNDSHLHQETLQDGRQVWVPNGAPTEVCVGLILGSFDFLITAG